MLGSAPASNNNPTTSSCPNEQALCNGWSPPSSWAWIDAPAANKSSTISRRPKPKLI